MLAGLEIDLMFRVAGLVLCGGQSRRMGQPKAWLPFAGEPMLARVVRLLGEAVQPVCVVAAPGQELPSLSNTVEIIRDPVEGRGPLQGIQVGLDALRGRADAAFVCGCDAPLLRPAFVRRLIDLLENHLICVPNIDGFQHSLAAVYRVEVAEVAGRLLAAGERRLGLLLDAVPTRRVSAAELANVDPELETLRNLNSPAEYEAALKRHGSASE